MLGDRHGHADYVHLLKAVPSDELAGNVSRDRYHGNRVQSCRSYACYEVRSPCVAVRGMSRALFVGREYLLYAVAGGVQLVKQVYDLSSRIAENSITALLDKGLNNDFCT